MLKSPYLLAIAVLLALLQWTSAAKAQESTFALTFDLPPANRPPANRPPANRQTATPALSLSISAPDALATTASELESAGSATDFDRDLTYQQEALPPIETTAFKASKTVKSVSAETNATEADSLELTFPADTVSLENLGKGNLYTETENSNTAEGNSAKDNTNDVSVLIDDTHETVLSAADANSTDSGLVLDDWIFEDGSNSLVARTVGSAEGTRQSDGEHTQAYYGHVDPGNGVWNLGTFSYQHGAESPAAADEKQKTK